MKKSVAVIGQGFVGGSLTTVLSENGLDVYAYDKAGKYTDEALYRDGKSSKRLQHVANEEYAGEYPSSIQDLVAVTKDKPGFSNVYFVCLPTPMKQSGEADLSIVDGALCELAAVPGNRIAVLKSTVPPGSTENWNNKFRNQGLNVIFCPEFLTEANALNDMRDQNRIILGTCPDSSGSIYRVKEVFKEAFPWTDIFITSSTIAESVKYFANIHLAVKVSLANEFYQIVEALKVQGLDVDYTEIVELATKDRRLGDSHWQVPGPMLSDDTGLPAFGYAGSCFPKDINALMFLARKLGVDPKVMSGSWQKNVEVRPQRDWEKLKGRAISEEK